MPKDISKEILKVDEEIKKASSDTEKCEGEVKIAESSVLQSTLFSRVFFRACKKIHEVSKLHVAV